MLESHGPGEDRQPVAVKQNVEKVVSQSNVVDESKGRTWIETLRGTFARFISAGPIEERGVMPVSLEDRNATNYTSYFSIWVCMNINLLP